MKKNILSVLLICAMSLGLVACSSETSTTGTDAAVDNVLRLQVGSEPAYLDPHLNSSSDGGILAANSFVGLYTHDINGDLTPALGEASVSEDQLTYTFTMIESKWSNGEELTANDFVWSWNRVIAEETAADYAYLYDVIARNEDGSLAVEAVDDYTLVVTMVSPCPYFLDLVAFPTFYPVHQESVEAADPDKNNPGAWAQEAGFISNGAYTLESWSHNESMVYVRNPYFYDAENVTFDSLEYMLTADDTAAYAAYLNGDIDLVSSIPTEEIKGLLERGEMTIADALGTFYIGFNVQSELFSGMTVEQANAFREAVSLLIDRDFIVDNITQSGQRVADSFIPAGMADGNGGIFKTDDVSYYDATTTGPAQLEKAVELLEYAGYTMIDNGDGTYSSDPAIGFEYITNSGGGLEEIGEAIQQDLAIVGIDMQIKSEDWNVFLEDRKSGNYSGLAREGWIADYDDPINMLEIFTSDSGNNDMQLGIGDAEYAPSWDEYDALISQIRTTADFEARVELMHQAEDILMETYAVIPLYYYNSAYVQGNVEGVIRTVTGMRYYMYAYKVEN